MAPHKQPVESTTEAESAPRLFVEPGLLKTMVEVAVRNLLEEEVSRHLGAAPYERTSARTGHRNGTKPRTMKTAVGDLHFDVPQTRDGTFKTQLFDRHQRSDKALVSALQEMVVAGVSTRRVAGVLEELGGFEVSAATVSRTMADLDASISAHFSRPLKDHRYPYLVVDARYEKVRKQGHVVSQAVLIVAGIREDGRREYLWLSLGDSESAESWGEVFSGLRARGLAGVELVVSDAHKGIQAALARHLQGVAWQRCRVHFVRELLAKVSWKDMKELARDLRSIYASEEAQQCKRVAAEVAAKWERRAPKMSAALLAGVESTLVVVGLLARETARRLNSTNMIERTMKEIRARTRKVGSFPNEAACRRLVGAVLLEMQDRWDEERSRYVVLERSRERASAAAPGAQGPPGTAGASTT